MDREHHEVGGSQLLRDRGSRPLTQAGHGEHPGGRGWGDAVGEDGLKHVVGEGHGDDSQAGGVHDENSTPEQQESVSGESQHGTGVLSTLPMLAWLRREGLG